MAKNNIFVPIVWGVIGLFSILYLINIGFGVIEFLPDNLTIVGNIDEGVATIGLLGAFTFFTKVNPIKLIAGGK